MKTFMSPSHIWQMRFEKISESKSWWDHELAWEEPVESQASYLELRERVEMQSDFFRYVDSFSVVDNHPEAESALSQICIQLLLGFFWELSCTHCDFRWLIRVFRHLKIFVMVFLFVSLGLNWIGLLSVGENVFSEKIWNYNSTVRSSNLNTWILEII